MNKRMAVILAAGKGTRMKSALYKVLHPVCGLPMVEHVRRAVAQSGVTDIVTVVGHGAEQVREILGDQLHYALQTEQLGTGHAVLQASEILADQDGQTLVICGDTPLLTAATLEQLFQAHQSSNAQATILSARTNDATGYGRIVRDRNGEVVRIVEQKDANEEDRAIQEFNTGTYVFDNRTLFQVLQQVTNNNAQGEYYLTDVIGLIKQAGGKVQAHVMLDEQEALGVNDRVALSQATSVMQQRIIETHMRNGVTFIQPLSTIVEADVIIGMDTIIEPGVVLKGDTVIGNHCLIGANSEIITSQIADHVQITQSVIEYSSVASGTTIGPFAHLRPNSHLGQNVHIGNFVEVKNSTVGDDTKAGHLTYIGDADLGRDINIGCGTIFVNFDGKKKHRSTIGDQVFIGCNANIVSPINVGDRAFIGAGTTVVQDVPEEALALSRVPQQNISNYWQKFLNK